MALRINTLARGFSGVSLNTFNTLVALFNSGCTPLVPCQGTVGASGDLAPLAHIGLALIGEGKIWDPKIKEYDNASVVLQRYGLAPVDLGPKDGLSLVNGTQFITGIGSCALEGGIISTKIAQPIAACSLIALEGIVAAMDRRVSACRPHPGQIAVSAIMRHLIPTGTNDPITTDVQDPYSLRCVPQVHGCVAETLCFLRYQLEEEMNSATDNPLVFTESNVCATTGKILSHIISGGNFHGEFPAKALDTLALQVGELGRISAARILLLVNPKTNRNLPAFIATDAGLDSGTLQ
jgi:histidine ammonia-lyase